MCRGTGFPFPRLLRGKPVRKTRPLRRHGPIIQRFRAARRERSCATASACRRLDYEPRDRLADVVIRCAPHRRCATVRSRRCGLEDQPIESLPFTTLPVKSERSANWWRFLSAPGLSGALVYALSRKLMSASPQGAWQGTGEAWRTLEIESRRGVISILKMGDLRSTRPHPRSSS